MPITQLPPSGTDNNQLFSTRAQVWCCRQLVAILKIEKIGYWVKMIGKKVYLAAFFFFFFFFLDSPSSSSGGGASSTGGGVASFFSSSFWATKSPRTSLVLTM